MASLALPFHPMKTTRLVVASLFFVLFTQTPCFSFSLPPPTDPSSSSPQVSAEEQTANAVQATANPAVSMAGQVVGAMGEALTGQSGKARGLQFKNPVVSLGLSERNWQDTAPGGFTGDDIGADVGLDFDVYDGWIVGFIYNHTYRGASNSQATSEHMDADGVSFYTARRFFDLMNAGISYNFVTADHRLTRGVQENLDRDSHGSTMFVGISDRTGKWAWSTTTSYTHVFDDYQQQKSLDTGIFTWGGRLGYDAHELFTVGAAFGHSTMVIQDVFPNSSVRDNDFWTLGPRFSFYPTEDITVQVEFDSMQGFADYRSYHIRVGLDVAF